MRVLSLKSVKNKKNKTLIILVVLIVAILAIGISMFTKDTKKTTQKSDLTISPTLGPTIVPETIIIFTKDGPTPNKVEIKRGKRVIWINRSGATISLNSDDHPSHNKYPLLNFGSIKDGSAAEHIFRKQGTYGFHNHLKPEQKGVIIVK